MLRWLMVRSVLLLCVTFAAPASSYAEIDAEQVKVAIEQGIKFLKHQQSPNGTWPEGKFLSWPYGVTSLCTLALINCGVPLEDPQIKSALNSIRAQKLTTTYSVSLQTMVLCAADPQRDLLKIQENVRWLEALQLKNAESRGGWGYHPKSESGDNSNSQFALLALYEASRVGVAVNDQTLRLAEQWWRAHQGPDGSWSYGGSPLGSGSMTCAGIGSMVMILDHLKQGDARVVADEVQCCGAADDDNAIARGMAWLGRYFSVHSNPNFSNRWLFYYLYAVERTGRLTNSRMIGGHDWYREGAEYLIKQQANPPGSWSGSNFESDQNVATSLALLFLAKGRRAVVVAKLKHEPASDWNLHRSDLANLVGYVEQRWRRDLTWQVIDAAKATPDDLMQSPVITIGGRVQPQLTDAQVENLRKYVDRGGFIFAESCCGDERFDQGIRELAARIFPEPEYQLRLLDPGHPIWTAEEPVDPNYVPPLYGVDYGCRTCFVYSPKNLGCYWELARVGRALAYSDKINKEIAAACSVGINVLAYATNRDLKFKLDASMAPLADGTQDKLERGRLTVAKLRHSGGWDVAPGALSNLLRVVSQQTGLRVVTDRREVRLTPDRIKENKLEDYHLIFMHGRNAFELSPADRAALKTYLERGGMLMADAVCGSEAFAQSMRRELALMFPQQKLQPIPRDHAMWTDQFGGFKLQEVNLRKPEPRKPGAPLQATLRAQPPELEGVQLDDRYAVVFSPYDLSCALERHDSLECPGYSRDDAARIGLNIILYSLH